MRIAGSQKRDFLLVARSRLSAVGHGLSVIGVNFALLGLQPEKILFPKKRLNH